MANEFIARNGLIAQNNSIVTGSLTVTNGITGSLSGSATNAVSASFALTASYVQTAQTASYVLSVSYAPSSIPSGPWGISNSSGVYTYYNTLSASIAAATSGQVIEMFADVTATSVAPLKPNVIIQGNGHTYTYSGNTGDVFVTPAGVGTYTYYFSNINIKGKCNHVSSCK